MSSDPGRARLVSSTTATISLCTADSLSRAASGVPLEQGINTAAGTVARTFAQASIHPLDTLKTRCQVLTCPPARQSSGCSTSGQASTSTSIRIGGSGRLQTAIATKAAPALTLAHGIKDVYLGLTGAIIGTIPTALLYFGVYEACSWTLKKRVHGKHAAALTHICSASAGAAVSALVRVPADVLKHSVQAYRYPDIFQAAKSILASKGWRGMYAGFGPTLLRDVPEIAIQFTLYSQLQAAASAHQQRNGWSISQALSAPWQHLVLGGVSGAVASTITMPLDVLKTTLQCATTRRSTVQVLQAIVADNGLPGLFAGCGPRVLQTSAMSAIFFVSFEALKAGAKQSLLVVPPVTTWQHTSTSRTADMLLQEDQVETQQYNFAGFPQLASTAQPLVVAADLA